MAIAEPELKKHNPTSQDRWCGWTDADGTYHLPNLSYLLRPHGQRRLFRALRDWRQAETARVAATPGEKKSIGPFVSICHRHFGKTSALVFYEWQRCLQRPGTRCLFIAPLDNQCDRNMDRPLAILMRNKPRAIITKQRGRLIKIWNPEWPRGSEVSEFHWMGSDGTGEREPGAHIRGIGELDIIVADEARDAKRLDHLWENVLAYSFQNRPDGFAAFISTPPPSLDHPLVRAGGFVEQAIAGRRYFLCRSSQNPDFNSADAQEIQKATGGGKGSNAWRREAECELIQDTEWATIPQYQDVRSVVEVESYQRPEHFFPLIAADTGWYDANALLAGYVDHDRQILVVEREFIVKQCTTRQFVNATQILECETFWNWDRPPRNPVRRYADATPQQLDDFWREHHLRYQAAEKYDFAGALARLRTIFAEGRIRILPEAPQLRYQCLTGLLNERGKLERTETLGHQDAIAALVYLARMAPWLEQPKPTVIPAESADRMVVPGYQPEAPPGPTVKPAAEAARILPLRRGYILPPHMRSDYVNRKRRAW